jgi:ferrochelatase
VGVLLANFGSPDAPDTASVRRYLRDFLSDPRVVDMNPLGRWLMLNLMVLPTRPARSAAAYRKVWTERGSPLVVHTLDFAHRLQERLGPGFHVEVGMRYGAPSIEGAVDALAARCRQVVVFPLYPQATSSSTGSTTEAVFRHLSGRWDVPPVSVVPPYFADEGYIEALAQTIGSRMEGFVPDHVLFSFHGIPERHIAKARREQVGLVAEGCCSEPCGRNDACYRSQCHRTAALVAERLAIPGDRWEVAFQSRFGRDPWIGPATDERLGALARSGVERLLVACPGFAADCLETLEEIGMEGRETFLDAGGSAYHLTPCLNDRMPWVEAASELVVRAAGVDEMPFSLAPAAAAV